MTEGPGPITRDMVFEWHPTYAGLSSAEVLASLDEEIRRDQRAYALAMEGAEQAEGASLTAIVELERRWSGYDFDWAEMDASVLAARILRFEQAREEKQSLFPFSEFRSSGSILEVDQPVLAQPARTLPVMKIGVVILVLLVVVFLLAVVF